MKQKFISKHFREDSLVIIGQANGILDKYSLDNIQLTLRQLYYQFVARDLFPEAWVDPESGSKNTQKNYKKLGALISDARDAGLVDWSAIEDRGRRTLGRQHWESGEQIVRAAANSFFVDRWKNQPYHIEVMAEKDAATSVIWPTCRELDVRFTANKGYGSSTLLYDVGQRIAYYANRCKNILVLYVGDHDPSGIDMTRDVLDRLEMYSQERVEVLRLALNYDQVQQWNPPENPTKELDPRAQSYIDQFGYTCWELDAVEPLTLRALVEQEILSRRDQALWDETVEAEAKVLSRLNDLADNFDEEGEEDGDD